jgi:hypothetical protein
VWQKGGVKRVHRFEAIQLLHALQHAILHYLCGLYLDLNQPSLISPV